MIRLVYLIFGSCTIRISWPRVSRLRTAHTSRCWVQRSAKSKRGHGREGRGGARRQRVKKGRPLVNCIWRGPGQGARLRREWELSSGSAACAHLEQCTLVPRRQTIAIRITRHDTRGGDGDAWRGPRRACGTELSQRFSMTVKLTCHRNCTHRGKIPSPGGRHTIFATGK